MKLYDEPRVYFDTSGMEIGTGHREYPALEGMGQVRKIDAINLLAGAQLAVKNPQEFFRRIRVDASFSSEDWRKFENSGRKTLIDWLIAGTLDPKTKIELPEDKQYDCIHKLKGKVANRIREEFLEFRRVSFLWQRLLRPMTECFYDVGEQDLGNLFNGLQASNPRIVRTRDFIGYERMCELLPERLYVSVKTGRRDTGGRALESMQLGLEAFNRTNGISTLRLALDISDEKPKLRIYHIIMPRLEEIRFSKQVILTPGIKIKFPAGENPRVWYTLEKGRCPEEGQEIPGRPIFDLWNQNLCLCGGTQLERILQEVRGMIAGRII